MVPEGGGLRPHPGWLALRMRDRLAPADEMLAAHLDRLPRLLRGEEAVPLFSTYALRGDDGRVYVFVLSLVLDDAHDGVDFGDGVTPVTLHLPFTLAPSAITVHRLARPDGAPADPRENNREETRIALLSEPVDLTEYHPSFTIDARVGGVEGGVPPGAAYLYVFDFD